MEIVVLYFWIIAGVFSLFMATFKGIKIHFPAINKFKKWFSRNLLYNSDYEKGRREKQKILLEAGFDIKDKHILTLIDCNTLEKDYIIDYAKFLSCGYNYNREVYLRGLNWDELESEFGEPIRKGLGVKEYVIQLIAFKESWVSTCGHLLMIPAQDNFKGKKINPPLELRLYCLEKKYLLSLLGRPNYHSVKSMASSISKEILKRNGISPFFDWTVY